MTGPSGAASSVPAAGVILLSAGAAGAGVAFVSFGSGAVSPAKGFELAGSSACLGGPVGTSLVAATAWTGGGPGKPGKRPSTPGGTAIKFSSNCGFAGAGGGNSAFGAESGSSFLAAEDLRARTIFRFARTSASAFRLGPGAVGSSASSTSVASRLLFGS